MFFNLCLALTLEDLFKKSLSFGKGSHPSKSPSAVRGTLGVSSSCCWQDLGSAMEKHSGKPGTDPLCFGSPSAVGEGSRSLVNFRNFSSAKTCPVGVTQGWGKGSVCHRKSGGKELGPGAGSWRSSFISSLVVNVWLPGIKVGISDTAGENSVPGCPQLLSVHSWKSWKNNEPMQWLKQEVWINLAQIFLVCLWSLWKLHHFLF